MTTLPLVLAAALGLLAHQPDPSPTPAPSTPASESAPEPKELSIVTLKDGQRLRGVLVSRDEAHVVLELASGGRVELPTASVEQVELESGSLPRADGQVWAPDPNRTRYLLAPSAMMLRQGEMFLSQREVFITWFEYGLNDHVTLQAGSVLPAWLLGVLNVGAGIKVGGALSDRLHLAASAQALGVPSLGRTGSGSGQLFALLSGTATYGTRDAHLSLGVGVPFAVGHLANTQKPEPFFTLGGNLRVARHVALVTEHWLFPPYKPVYSRLPMANALAVRLFGESWAVDLGLVQGPSGYYPYPWLDITYHFK